MKLKKNAIFLFVLFLLLGAALKNDLEGLEVSDFWSQLPVHPLVSFLKRDSYVFLLLAGGIGLFSLITAKRFSIRVNSISLALIFLSGCAVLRAAYLDMGAALKLVQGLFLLLFVVATSGILMSHRGGHFFRREMVRAFYWFSVIFILINAMNFVFGYGFVPGNARYFGTAIHPNFMGIQLAICNIAIASRMANVRLSSWRRNLFPALLLFAGIAAQLATGSRSSLAMLVTGLSFMWWARRKFQVDIWSVVPASLLIGVFVYSVELQSSAGSAFYRGENQIDTRTGAWSSMLSLIEVHPWQGHGYFTGYSENSILRAMVAFGIPYGLFFLLVVFACAIQHFRMSWRCRQEGWVSEHSELALLSGLLMGSMFEGYLMDSWSLPKLSFVLLAVSAASATRRNAKFSDPRFDQRPHPAKRPIFGSGMHLK